MRRPGQGGVSSRAAIVVAALISLFGVQCFALTYDQWARSAFTSGDYANPLVSGSTAVNAAGVPNLISYAFASGNPYSHRGSDQYVTYSVVTETGTVIQ